MTVKHTGACFCGTVTLEVASAPEAMGYCHCSSCRSWSAGPVNAFTLWKPDNVKVTSGAEFLGRFQKSANSERRWCTKCGGHVFTHHPVWGRTDVYAATIPGIGFAPALHVNYAETVLPMKDALPKLKDFPAELGGSGVALAEERAARLVNEHAAHARSRGNGITATASRTPRSKRAPR